MKVGVLAVQGDVSEHIRMLEIVGAEPVRIKTVGDMDKIDGLIIPGGESTTIGKLIKRNNLDSVITKRISEGMPVYGTCAGMILLAKKIKDFSQFTLNVLDITIIRNIFGRQIDSMELDLDIKDFDSKFHATFIRAPVAVEPGKGVNILSTINEGIVFLQQGNILASSFHPELGEDSRVHKYFIDIIKKKN
jgi:5'-phosphate synthase pdxT subunit